MEDSCGIVGGPGAVTGETEAHHVFVQVSPASPNPHQFGRKIWDRLDRHRALLCGSRFVAQPAEPEPEVRGDDVP